MKTHARVVVIGGGVVGASVLYHLTKAGWKDVVLVEREQLTHGSTWHAAGGFHTLNGDPNVAKLQGYTIALYDELEKISGESCGLHRSGGLMLAEAEARGSALFVLIFEEMHAARNEVRLQFQQVCLRLGVVVVGQMIVEPLVVGVVEAELLEVFFQVPVNLRHEKKIRMRRAHVLNGQRVLRIPRQSNFVAVATGCQARSSPLFHVRAS